MPCPKENMKCLHLKSNIETMDLQIRDKNFIVGGAGSGFGRAIAESLASEGANVLAVSRTEEKLKNLKKQFSGQVDYIAGDIMTETIQGKVMQWTAKKHLSGVLVNAGGPPAGGFDGISMEQWQEAWNSVVKWKIAFTKKIIPVFRKQHDGRMVFIESVSVKQPVKNLILSNALRPAVVGFVKTLSQEVAAAGITLNVLAPGYHSTAALKRLFDKKSEMENITPEEARRSFENEIPVGQMATPEEMAPLALWLLSPLSRYVTGQTFSHDGGIVQGFFG